MRKRVWLAFADKLETENVQFWMKTSKSHTLHK